MEADPGNLTQLLLFLPLISFGQVGPYLLFLLLLIGSFTASGAEVAFFSLTKAEVDEIKSSDSPVFQRIWRMISRPKKLLATILITNNFMNVAAILVSSYLLQIFSRAFTWNDSIRFLVEVVLITAILLFFGEILPKVYAARNRMRIVRLFAIPIDVLQWMLTPLSKALVHGTAFIEKRVQFKEEAASRDDLRNAIDLTHDPEAETDDQGILKGIVNFSNISVKNIMRARVDVFAIEENTPFPELIDQINANSFSRLPVYEESLDNIKGILHIKDLLPYLKKDAPAVDLAEVLRDVYFVPESKKIDHLLEDFKRQRLHMAVVVDEFGGTAGIVTLEDVIEEIFGEITDEFDSEDWVYTKLDENTYIFEGRISLLDVKKIVGLEEETFEDARGDSDSLGGLILELHGKIPKEKEEIRYQDFLMIIEGVSENRITQIKFVRELPKEDQGNG